MGEGRHRDAQHELVKAREALSDAQVLLDGDGTPSGVLNRLYYAAFHGAQAALFAHGINPTSHGHLRQQFGQQLVLDGDATREMGRLLGTLYDYRRAADYGSEPPDVDLSSMSAEVVEFVESMEDLVADRATEG